MIVRYFDVDPLATGIGYGFSGFMQGRREKEAEEHRKEYIKRKKRQKLTAVGVGALAGGVGGLALAPALGAAGAAGGTLGGASMFGGGVAGTLAPTVGALGTGGVLSGVGSIAAGLTGAAVGAQAGQMIAGEDYAGALGTVAAPIAGTLMGQQARRDRFSDLTSLEAFRTNENIRQFEEQQSIKDYGMPTAEVNRLAEQMISGGPGGGPSMQPPDFPMDQGGISSPNLAPSSDNPYQEGPSSIPGMDKKYLPPALKAWAKLEQEKQETIDSPDWKANTSLDQQGAHAWALARARRAIKTSLVPSPPKPTIAGPGGQRIPMQLGENPAQDGGVYLWDGKDMKHVAPTKQSEVGVPWNDPNFAKLSPEQKRAANIAFGKTRIIPGAELGPGYDQDSDYGFDDKGTPHQFKHQKDAGDDYDVSDYLKDAKTLEKPDPKYPMTKTIPASPSEVLAAREEAEATVETFNARKKLSAAVDTIWQSRAAKPLPPAAMRALLQDVADAYGTEVPSDIARKLRDIAASEESLTWGR